MREQLTRKDVEKIEQEIEHRKLVVRKEAIEAVKEARAQGDLSENFEYYAAKKHKNQNESRIRYLERMLKTASIVSDDSRDDEVGMDDIVEVLFEFYRFVFIHSVFCYFSGIFRLLLISCPLYKSYYFPILIIFNDSRWSRFLAYRHYLISLIASTKLILVTSMVLYTGSIIFLC